MKQIYEMRGAGHSTRAIARELRLARNTVLRYLKSPEAIRPKPRSRRGSKLDPYTEHLDWRLGDGLENCVVLLRELRDLGYDGSNTILSEYVRPRRRRRQPEATMRFETAPGEQAQVDWGSLSYIGADGKQRRVWVFVMTLGWSRACYVELVRKADTAAFIQCHVNAFEYLGGVPRRCLYDNAKVVTLGRDEEKRPIWNQRMLDFALRVGFEARLCQPYRAQTKLGFTQFKRRRQGNLQVGGTERPGVPECRGQRPTVRNLPTPATGGDAPGRWHPRRSATVCRTKRPCAGSWGAVSATRGRPGWSRRRVPVGRAWCGRWRDRTTGVVSPHPDGFVPRGR